MNLALRIGIFLSRILGIFFCVAVLVFATALVGGILGRGGPLTVGPYAFETDTPGGMLVSLVGAIMAGALVWLFVIQVPYLCIRSLPRSLNK
jgi:hypothetical protein